MGMKNIDGKGCFKLGSVMTEWLLTRRLLVAVYALGFYVDAAAVQQILGARYSKLAKATSDATQQFLDGVPTCDRVLMLDIGIYRPRPKQCFSFRGRTNA